MKAIMNILCIDDEPFVLEQIKYMIGEAYPHWEIFTAYDGVQAAHILDHHYIDLAFVDIELPGKNGLELSKTFKEKHPHVTIIILSAHQEFKYAQQAIQIGVSDYLTKPIIEKELLALLDAYAVNNDFSSIVMNAVRFIQANYREKISLPQLAKEIHVNPSYLSRKFHEETGVTFSEYVLNHRIKAAKELMAKNRIESVSSIAEQCGFSSPHYFSTVFKRKTGLTPKEYKEGMKLDVE
jgi:YesN/AraC family two-component response regulator